MALPDPSPSSTALVTGASSGIGIELARGLARRGHNVVLVARRKERLEQLAGDLANAFGVRAEAISADLGSAAARGRMAGRVDKLGLDVDVLCNNAGFGTYKLFHQADREREIEEVRLNVEAVVDLSARYLPPMVRRRRGAVLNTASTAAFQPLPSNATYSATKAFVLAHSEAIHHEVKGEGVTVTALCPGPVATEFQSTAELRDPEHVMPSFMWEPADEVAEAALRGLERGRRVVIPGIPNAVGALAGRMTPRTVLLPVMGIAARRGLSA